MFHIPIKLKAELARASMTTSDVNNQWRSNFQQQIKFIAKNSTVIEMDGRPVAKYLNRDTKRCSKLGSHWPNKKHLGDCLKDR